MSGVCFRSSLTIKCEMRECCVIQHDTCCFKYKQLVNWHSFGFLTVYSIFWCGEKLFPPNTSKDRKPWCFFSWQETLSKVFLFEPLHFAHINSPNFVFEKIILTLNSHSIQSQTIKQINKMAYWGGDFGYGGYGGYGYGGLGGYGGWGYGGW